MQKNLQKILYYLLLFFESMIYYIHKTILFYNKGEIIMWFQKKKTNYGKIIAITLAAVAGVSAIAFVVYKLVKKYTEEVALDCDDFLDECEECELAAEGEEECVECCAEAADAE